MVKHKIAEMRAKREAVEFACAAGGKIWNEEYSRLCSYRDLITHSNPEIRARWLASGENEFSPLFRGFPPNKIDGIGVLDWIKKTEVPNGKKCTYPRYTVAMRPEKEEVDRTRITCG